jgi:lysozyme
MKDLQKLIFFILGISILYRMTKNMDKYTGTMTDLIKKFEGYKDKAYQDVKGIWTIGFGLTQYPNGVKVQPGDTITREQGEQYFKQTLQKFAQGVEDSVKAKINNNQFSALVSLAYNIGLTAFKNSTLLKLVNNNPNNPAIQNEFMKWVYSGGKKVNGLITRREAESKLYFS